MAILRKNRLNSPTTSPDRDTTTTPARGPRTALKALFSNSPTSFINITNPAGTGTATSTGSTIGVTGTSISTTNNNRFNPKLIFAQIVAIQSLHYLILSFLFQINHTLTGQKITLDRIFTSQYLQLWTAEGWIDNSAILLSSVFNAILLAFIVEKSKKCLDFSITLFSLHFMFCVLYGGFPASWDWWIIHVLGLIVMVLLGEYFCSKVELRDIPLL